MSTFVVGLIFILWCISRMWLLPWILRWISKKIICKVFILSSHCRDQCFWSFCLVFQWPKDLYDFWQNSTLNLIVEIIFWPNNKSDCYDVTCLHQLIFPQLLSTPTVVHLRGQSARHLRSNATVNKGASYRCTNNKENNTCAIVTSLWKKQIGS